MTRRKKVTPTEERRGLRAARARLMAEAERLSKQVAADYEAAKREMEERGAEDVAASRELLRHENLLVRAHHDPSPLDWAGKLAVHGYDRAAHDAAQLRAELAEARHDKAVAKLVRLGNWAYRPAGEAREMLAVIGESYERGTAGRAESARLARERKELRDETIRNAVRDAATTKKRRNPSLSASEIAKLLSAEGVVVTLPGADEPIVVDKVSRDLVSRVLRQKSP